MQRQQSHGAEKLGDNVASQKAEPLPTTGSLSGGRCAQGLHKGSCVVAAEATASQRKTSLGAEKEIRHIGKFLSPLQILG